MLPSPILLHLCVFLFFSHLRSHSNTSVHLRWRSTPTGLWDNPSYVLALCSTNEIVSLRSTCKQAPVAVAMVAWQCRGNGGDVKNMSCEIESTSAVL